MDPLKHPWMQEPSSNSKQYSSSTYSSMRPSSGTMGSVHMEDGSNMRSLLSSTLESLGEYKTSSTQMEGELRCLNVRLHDKEQELLELTKQLRSCQEELNTLKVLKSDHDVDKSRITKIQTERDALLHECSCLKERVLSLSVSKVEHHDLLLETHSLKTELHFVKQRNTELQQEVQEQKSTSSGLLSQLQVLHKVVDAAEKKGKLTFESDSRALECERKVHSLQEEQDAEKVDRVRSEGFLQVLEEKLSSKDSMIAQLRKELEVQSKELKAQVLSSQKKEEDMRTFLLEEKKQTKVLQEQVGTLQLGQDMRKTLQSVEEGLQAVCHNTKETNVKVQNLQSRVEESKEYLEAVVVKNHMHTSQVPVELGKVGQSFESLLVALDNVPGKVVHILSQQKQAHRGAALQQSKYGGVTDVENKARALGIGSKDASIYGLASMDTTSREHEYQTIQDRVQYESNLGLRDHSTQGIELRTIVHEEAEDVKYQFQQLQKKLECRLCDQETGLGNVTKALQELPSNIENLAYNTRMRQDVNETVERGMKALDQRHTEVTNFLLNECKIPLVSLLSDNTQALRSNQREIQDKLEDVSRAAIGKDKTLQDQFTGELHRVFTELQSVYNHTSNMDRRVQSLGTSVQALLSTANGTESLVKSGNVFLGQIQAGLQAATQETGHLRNANESRYDQMQSQQSILLDQVRSLSQQTATSGMLQEYINGVVYKQEKLHNVSDQILKYCKDSDANISTTGSNANNHSNNNKNDVHTLVSHLEHTVCMNHQDVLLKYVELERSIPNCIDYTSITQSFQQKLELFETKLYNDITKYFATNQNQDNKFMNGRFDELVTLYRAMAGNQASTNHITQDMQRLLQDNVQTSEQFTLLKTILKELHDITVSQYNTVNTTMDTSRSKLYTELSSLLKTSNLSLLEQMEVMKHTIQRHHSVSEATTGKQLTLVEDLVSKVDSGFYETKQDLKFAQSQYHTVITMLDQVDHGLCEQTTMFTELKQDMDVYNGNIATYGTTVNNLVDGIDAIDKAMSENSSNVSTMQHSMNSKYDHVLEKVQDTYDLMDRGVNVLLEKVEHTYTQLDGSVKTLEESVLTTNDQMHTVDKNIQVQLDEYTTLLGTNNKSIHEKVQLLANQMNTMIYSVISTIEATSAKNQNATHANDKSMVANMLMVENKIDNYTKTVTAQIVTLLQQTQDCTVTSKDSVLQYITSQYKVLFDNIKVLYNSGTLNTNHAHSSNTTSNTNNSIIQIEQLLKEHIALYTTLSDVFSNRLTEFNTTVQNTNTMVQSLSGKFELHDTTSHNKLEKVLRQVGVLDTKQDVVVQTCHNYKHILEDVFKGYNHDLKTELQHFTQETSTHVRDNALDLVNLIQNVITHVNENYKRLEGVFYQYNADMQNTMTTGDATLVREVYKMYEKLVPVCSAEIARGYSNIHVDVENQGKQLLYSVNTIRDSLDAYYVSQTSNPQNHSNGNTSSNNNNTNNTKEISHFLHSDILSHISQATSKILSSQNDVTKLIHHIVEEITSSIVTNMSTMQGTITTNYTKLMDTQGKQYTTSEKHFTEVLSSIQGQQSQYSTVVSQISNFESFTSEKFERVQNNILQEIDTQSKNIRTSIPVIDVAKLMRVCTDYYNHNIKQTDDIDKVFQMITSVKSVLDKFHVNSSLHSNTHNATNPSASATDNMNKLRYIANNVDLLTDTVKDLQAHVYSMESVQSGFVQKSQNSTEESSVLLQLVQRDVGSLHEEQHQVKAYDKKLQEQVLLELQQSNVLRTTQQHNVLLQQLQQLSKKTDGIASEQSTLQRFVNTVGSHVHNVVKVSTQCTDTQENVLVPSLRSVVSNIDEMQQHVLTGYNKMNDINMLVTSNLAEMREVMMEIHTHLGDNTTEVKTLHHDMKTYILSPYTNNHHTSNSTNNNQLEISVNQAIVLIRAIAQQQQVVAETLGKIDHTQEEQKSILENMYQHDEDTSQNQSIILTNMNRAYEKYIDGFKHELVQYYDTRITQLNDTQNTNTSVIQQELDTKYTQSVSQNTLDMNSILQELDKSLNIAGLIQQVLASTHKQQQDQAYKLENLPSELTSTITNHIISEVYKQFDHSIQQNLENTAYLNNTVKQVGQDIQRALVHLATLSGEQALMQ